MGKAHRATGCVVKTKLPHCDDIGILAVCSHEIGPEMVSVDRKVEE
ncbi:MAG: hypothetical protein ACXW1Y_06490 [Acidimicrobiia bacterium]